MLVHFEVHFGFLGYIIKIYKSKPLRDKDIYLHSILVNHLILKIVC